MSCELQLVQHSCPDCNGTGRVDDGWCLRCDGGGAIAVRGMTRGEWRGFTHRVRLERRRERREWWAVALIVSAVAWIIFFAAAGRLSGG